MAEPAPATRILPESARRALSLAGLTSDAADILRDSADLPAGLGVGRRQPAHRTRL